ncbi:MAG: tetratricopeptide repeat protein, partial [Gammaproteobacteria bacterium]|nr:tetratricopeptide repeat protein [Gammaproteobacteria bacterium]
AAVAEEPSQAATPAALPQPAPATTTAIEAIDQRMQAYDQFKAMFETARFEEALPLAQRVVELSEVDRDRDIELPIAYNNLGATLYQLNKYEEAEASYTKSLSILEATQGISSRRLIVPLAGLGTVYAATDQHALAAKQFDRALAVSRRSDGLFNLAQLPMIEMAADSRFALGDYGGVERDHFYALRIAEQNYGYNDPRTLPPAMRLASFYESLKEYVAARGLYLRVRDISMKESGGFNPLVVKSLISIGRTHRLQYTMAPESLESQLPTRDKVTGEIGGGVYSESRDQLPAPDRSGLKSIEKALEILRATRDPPPVLLAETLTELGDWYQATSRAGTAIPFYAEASAIYAADSDSGMGNPLLAPRMIFYRPPLASTRSIGNVTGDVVMLQAVFSFVVSETGQPQNVTVVSSDMADGQLAQCRRAVEHANYSPRIMDGKPVATEGVQFTARWYEQREAETPSTTG